MTNQCLESHCTNEKYQLIPILKTGPFRSLRWAPKRDDVWLVYRSHHQGIRERIAKHVALAELAAISGQLTGGFEREPRFCTSQLIPWGFRSFCSYHPLDIFRTCFSIIWQFLTIKYCPRIIRSRIWFVLPFSNVNMQKFFEPGSL